VREVWQQQLFRVDNSLGYLELQSLKNKGVLKVPTELDVRDQLPHVDQGQPYMSEHCFQEFLLFLAFRQLHAFCD
jgi:hypothetical protein